MKSRQELIVDLLKEKLKSTKVGIIVNGVDGISPSKAAKDIGTGLGSKVYVVVIGYDGATDSEDEYYSVSTRIESAVAWRNNPNCAGKIIVFIRGDVDKMHSLNVLDRITKKDLSAYLIDQQIEAVADENKPIREFWEALRETTDYYTLQNLEEYISTVEGIADKTIAISNNLWVLNLLCDESILGAKIDRVQRLIDNKNKIIEIAQLTENARKNLSKSLVRASVQDKVELQKAYKRVEAYSQYGSREILKDLDYAMVESLLSATKPKKKTPAGTPPVPTPPATPGSDTPETPEPPGTDPQPGTGKPLKQKDVDDIVIDQLLFGEEEGLKDIQDVYDALKDAYADESKSKASIDNAGGIFRDASIDLDIPQDSLRKLVGTLCNENAWGGKLEVKDLLLKDAISSSATPMIFSPFSLPVFRLDQRPLYEILKGFDATFAYDDSFVELFDTITEARKKLCEYIDFLMYNPYILISSNKDARDTLALYVETWQKLYEVYNAHYSEMASISSDPTDFVGRALIVLDVLYVHTGDGKWKGILLPLHPLFLWSYYEISKTVFLNKSSLGKSELVDLKSVLRDPPQLLNYLALDGGITNESDLILPCSGSIQKLPTYENSTNRFLGDDGLEAIPDVLERWLYFAPFSVKEVRICTVDAPNLSGIIRKVAGFITKNNVNKLIYDVYYTRGQNGNTEMASLDYSDKDYEIGEYIKNGRFVISIHTKSVNEIQTELVNKPVHVAFYFDQSKYEVKEKLDEGRLYSNPFVVTYDFRYDPFMHTGSISPSSRSQTGILGDYHSLMVATSFFKEKKSPWLSVDASDSMEGMLSVVKNHGAQWLVVADRNIGSYEIKDDYELIPWGEETYDRRRVGIWASSTSRIIDQYQDNLMNYNLTPDKETLVEMIKRFGHIAASGKIGLPKVGFDSKTTKIRQKGLLGTLFAATWYTKREESQNVSVMIASLDSDKARTWLTARDEEPEDTDKKLGQERADLIGLKYDKTEDTLYLQAIEVKTRDEASESQRDYELYTDEYGQQRLRNHAPKQVAAIIRILKSIFDTDSPSMDGFVSARREVLKYQIITECFRNIHDKAWQEEWHKVLSRAFEKDDRDGLRIVVSGLLVYIRLGDASTKDSKPIQCLYEGNDDYEIELSVLTSHDIQKQIFDKPDLEHAPVVEESESNTSGSGSEPIEPVVSDEGTDDNHPTNEVTEETVVDSVATVATESEETIEPEPETIVAPTVQENTTSSTTKSLEEVRFLLGEDPRSKEKFYWEFGHKQLNNRHLLINGNSGSGKTYCIQALLMEASLQGISSAVFDFTGGFTPKKLEPEFSARLEGRIRQRIVRAERIPINPFKRQEVDLGDGMYYPESDVDIAGRIAETIASVYSMGDQQKSAVYTAALSGLRKHGESMSFRHLSTELEDIGSSYSKTALSKIRQFIDIDPFVSGEAFDWSDIQNANGMVYIFQFMGYGRDVQVMLTELLLWDLWSFSVKSGSEAKPFIYVIDEAQNLSHSAKSPSGLILTEGRKYGLSGWYATQFMKPQLDDDEIQRLQQADQKLYFCPPGDGVMTVAKNIDITSQGTKEWAERLQKLNKGECVTCGSMVRGGKWNKYTPRVIKISSLNSRTQQ